MVYELENDGEFSYKYLLTWKFNKPVLQVLLGIAILTLCAKPLVFSIEDFSNAVGIPPFLIPFVMVPLALNARMAIAAIFPASQKSSKTASLTFSEVLRHSLSLSFSLSHIHNDLFTHFIMIVVPLYCLFTDSVLIQVS